MKSLIVKSLSIQIENKESFFNYCIGLQAFGV